MKRISKAAAALLAVLLLLTACQPATPTASTAPTQAPAAATPAPAGATAAPAAATAEPAPVDEPIVSEDFSSYYTSEITTLNYLVTNKSVDAELIGAFLDPLIIVNNYGALEPGMALSWEQSADGTKWTFKIREGVQWQKWDGTPYGAEITAQDWVDAVELILDPNAASLTVDFVLQFVAGAKEYYDSKVEGYTGAPVEFDSVGVKAIDKYTLEYTTTGVYPFYPSLLTYSCFLPINKAFVEEVGGMGEFGTDKDKFLYYGEYLFQTWLRDQEWTLVKNPEYYFADRVHVNVRNYVQIQDTKVALEMFKRGEISSASIISDQADAAFADPELSPYIYRTSLTSASWYYLFNFASPNANFVSAAGNINFRKAVLSAFNRTTILAVSNKFDPEYLRRNTLNIWGLSIDENGKDYMTYDKLPEIEARDSYDPAAAKQFIETAKAELGSSVTWPVTIVLFTTNTESAMNTSNVIKQSIEDVLEGDVLVDFYAVPAADYYDEQEKGNFDFTNSGWSPDFADPSAYLEINQVDGYIGSRYGFAKVPEWQTFDAMMKDAKAKTKLSERFAALAAAEVYSIENALIIPYRGNGGNYAINNIQNPYDTTSNVAYGLCSYKWLDRVYGKQPITLEEREAQKAAYDAGK